MPDIKIGRNNRDTVPVFLGPPTSRSYPIVFAPISDLGDVLIENGITPSQGKKCVVISNTCVGKLKHKAQCIDSLDRAGWDVFYIEIQDGEQFKTAETYLKVIDELLDRVKVDRKSLIVGLGGGVTTDIVGFAASTCLRGMRFVNVPTSLLAMVDASVGGKTGVNTPNGKNLLGTFWQPILVLASVDALKTLSPDEFRCGMGEVVKHGVIEETGAFFRWMEENVAKLKVSASPAASSGEQVLNYDISAIQHCVKQCCKIKGRIVEEDEREDGKRALLNLGHTVGHAIEHVMGFGKIPHGVAVAIGTVAEARLAELRKECDEPGKLGCSAFEINPMLGLAKRIARLLQEIGLPFHLESEGATVPELLDAVLMDKKRDGTLITITVPKRIGCVELVKVKPSDLEAAFESLKNSKSLLEEAHI